LSYIILFGSPSVVFVLITKGGSSKVDTINGQPWRSLGNFYGKKRHC
jgi:hypothetical protein